MLITASEIREAITHLGTIKACDDNNVDVSEQTFDNLHLFAMHLYLLPF